MVTSASSIIPRLRTADTGCTANDSEAKGRRTITWKIFRGLAVYVVDRIMTKVEALQTSFYLRFTYTYQLRNNETGKVILFHPNIIGARLAARLC